MLILPITASTLEVPEFAAFGQRLPAKQWRSVRHLQRQAGRLLNTAKESLRQPVSAQASSAVQQPVTVRTAAQETSVPQSHTYDSDREDRQSNGHYSKSTANTTLRHLEVEQSTWQGVDSTSAAAEGTGAGPNTNGYAAVGTSLVGASDLESPIKSAEVATSNVRRQDNGQLSEGSGQARQEGVQHKQHQHTSYISEIYIRDFALVEDQRVVLQPGFNIITGESGAGKSVLVTALGQVLGSATIDGCIRPPAQRALVEAQVQLSPAAAGSLAFLFRSLELPRKALPPQHAYGAKLLLRREISSTGKEGKGKLRSRCFVNGAAVSLRALRAVGEALVDVNGQHAAQSLRDSATQVSLLDRLAGTASAAARFGRRLEQLRASEAQLAALDALGDEAHRDSLQAMVDQVGKAKVRPGEERILRAELRQMDSRRAAVERCGMVRMALVGDDSAGGLTEPLRQVEGHLRAILSQEEAERPAEGEGILDETSEGAQIMEAALEHLHTVRQSLTQAESQVRQYARQFRFSQQERDEMAQQLEVLDRLFRRFDCSTSEELLALADKAASDLDHWFASQDSREDIEAHIADLRARLAQDGVTLSQQRRAAAGKLRAVVEGCLADLAMPGSRFDVRIGWEPAPQDTPGLLVPNDLASSVYEAEDQRYKARSSGLDTVEFLLAAGPAEPLRPLGAVASGGERARIMLALKAAPAAVTAAAEEQPLTAGLLTPNSDAGSSSALMAAKTVPAGVSGTNGAESDEDLADMNAPVMVLDELDSGVGGRLGTPVGRMLQRMVQAGPLGASQILCVSHLPQVAAHASHHVVVRKGRAEDGRILTHFASLAGEAERAQEVGEMLGLGTIEALQMLRAAHS